MNVKKLTIFSILFAAVLIYSVHSGSSCESAILLLNSACFFTMLSQAKPSQDREENFTGYLDDPESANPCLEIPVEKFDHASAA